MGQALVNVGAEVVKTVPGRVSTEVDARLAYDTQGIVNEASVFIFIKDQNIVYTACPESDCRGYCIVL